jgi:hypothetical protein
MKKMNFIHSKSLSSLRMDALVTNDSHDLLFLSAWGSETVIQNVRARLAVPVTEGGLRGFEIDGGPLRWRSDRVVIEKPEDYVEITGRPAGQSRFRQLTQWWMVSRLAETPDVANHQALLLRRLDEDSVAWQQRLWQAVQTVCPVPMHPAWDCLVADFIRQGWVKEYRGFQLDAWYLKLPETEVQPFITAAIQQGRLRLPTTH